MGSVAIFHDKGSQLWQITLFYLNLRFHKILATSRTLRCDQFSHSPHHQTNGFPLMIAKMSGAGLDYWDKLEGDSFYGNELYVSDERTSLSDFEICWKGLFWSEFGQVVKINVKVYARIFNKWRHPEKALRISERYEHVRSLNVSIPYAWLFMKPSVSRILQVLSLFIPMKQINWNNQMARRKRFYYN